MYAEAFKILSMLAVFQMINKKALSLCSFTDIEQN